MPRIAMRSIVQSLALALIVCIPLSIGVAYAIGDGLDDPDGADWYGYFFFPFFFTAGAAHRLLAERLDSLVFAIGLIAHVLPYFIVIHLLRVIIARRRAEA